MSEAKGQFVWYELMTTDVGAARAFYSELMGWKTQSWTGGEYESWLAGETAIGGLMKLPDEAKKHGAPPHWMGYVSTADVDTTATRAKELGGNVLVPPKDIPDVGRFAVLADPQGASFAIFSSKSEGPSAGREGLGHFRWSELNTTDWKAAWKFYSTLFDWKETGSMDMGPGLGEYFMFGVDPKEMIGGMSNAATMMKAPAHWLHYAIVKSVDESVKQIEAKGGKILDGPMDVPGGDRVAQCMDPQGGVFGLYSSGTKP